MIIRFTLDTLDLEITNEFVIAALQDADARVPCDPTEEDLILLLNENEEVRQQLFDEWSHGDEYLSILDVEVATPEDAE